jgi:hypothetical protein
VLSGSAPDEAQRGIHRHQSVLPQTLHEPARRKPEACLERIQGGARVSFLSPAHRRRRHSNSSSTHVAGLREAAAAQRHGLKEQGVEALCDVRSVSAARRQDAERAACGAVRQQRMRSVQLGAVSAGVARLFLGGALVWLALQSAAQQRRATDHATECRVCNGKVPR